MIDELTALNNILTSQRKWRTRFGMVFIVIILTSTVFFVVFPKTLPPMLMQVVLLLTMASVFGLFFLNVISHLINKRQFQHDVVDKYLYQFLKADDVRRDSELVLELLSTRRKNSEATRLR